jgi:hypothetical protein
MFKMCGTKEAKSDTMWNACEVNVHLVGTKLSKTQTFKQNTYIHL